MPRLRLLEQHLSRTAPRATPSTYFSVAVIHNTTSGGIGSYHTATKTRVGAVRPDRQTALLRFAAATLQRSCDGPK
jgi:hypothetical protein